MQFRVEYWTTLGENKMLNNLSTHQLEQALAWIHHARHQPPPQELESLTPAEWYVLTGLLRDLLAEKLHHPVH
jgi:hypothetical protein